MYGMKRFYYEIFSRIPSLNYRLIHIRTRGEHKLSPTSEFILNYYFLNLIQIFKAKSTLSNEITVLASQNLGNILNFFSFRRSIIICFDLIELSEFGHYQSWLTKILKWKVYNGIKKADKVITISQYSKYELVNKLKIDPDRIDIIPYAIDRKTFHPIPFFSKKQYLNLYNIPENFKIILYVGSEQPRKNLILLIEALAYARPGLPDFVFIKVGNPEWKNGRELFTSALLANDLMDVTRIIDYADDELLQILYNLADVFVFPSLYEGFGVPPLEAMSCGCPVITSDKTSLPEVVGNSAIVVNPYEKTELGDAILEVLTNDILRKDLINKGIEHSKRYDWDNNANLFIRTLNSLN
jgi:glycosyltransferase involved in cell wall biosynthesis